MSVELHIQLAQEDEVAPPLFHHTLNPILYCLALQATT